MKTPTVPEWYRQHPVSTVGGIKYSRPRGNITRRTLKALTSMMERLFASPQSCSSPFSGIEPRARVIICLVLLAGSTLAHALWQLMIFFAAGLFIACMAGVPLKSLLAVWLGVPLFSLAIILPSMTNLITPGHAVLTVAQAGGSWGLPCEVTITGHGIIVASRFLLRALCCVTFSAVLVASTGPEVLINALRRMGMPVIFGMVLTMMHRYLVIVLHMAEELHLAKLSRTIQPGTAASGQRWTAAGMVMLFRKSSHLSKEVHHAMLSRGFDGDLQVARALPFHRADYLAMASALMFVTLMLSVTPGGAH